MRWVSFCSQWFSFSSGMFWIHYQFEIANQMSCVNSIKQLLKLVPTSILMTREGNEYTSKIGHIFMVSFAL